MERLKISNIEAKIITGDNIYIAIETAIRCGILSKSEKVLVLEGKNQSNSLERKAYSGKILEKTDTTVKS